jgi:hypothetical protein
MKGYVGEFEELVLLTVASLGDEAYGVSIKEDIERRSDRTTSLGWVSQRRSVEEDANASLKSHIRAKSHCMKSNNSATTSGSYLSKPYRLQNEIWFIATTAAPRGKSV